MSERPTFNILISGVGGQGVVLATKFGNLGGAGGKYADGRPDFVISSCEASLKRLGVDVIDLYYQHRIDPNVPIEDTVGAMKKLVEQGKVRALGLSEAAPSTIRKAHKVHPIAAVQNEFSLLYRDLAEETLKTTRELGISFVAYAPIGRGLLSQEIADPATLAEGDTRKRYIREIARVCGKLHARALQSLDEGALPLVIGGDHSLGAGSVGASADFAKARGQELGVLWIDAHADLNTPVTSPSGNIHGMPMAALLVKTESTVIAVSVSST